MKYSSYRFPVGLGGHQVFVCAECAAIVDDKPVHDEWHQRLTAGVSVLKQGQP